MYETLCIINFHTVKVCYILSITSIIFIMKHKASIRLPYKILMEVMNQASRNIVSHKVTKGIIVATLKIYLLSVGDFSLEKQFLWEWIDLLSILLPHCTQNVRIVSRCAIVASRISATAFQDIIISCSKSCTRLT